MLQGEKLLNSIRSKKNEWGDLVKPSGKRVPIVVAPEPKGRGNTASAPRVWNGYRTTDNGGTGLTRALLKAAEKRRELQKAAAVASFNESEKNRALASYSKEMTRLLQEERKARAEELERATQRQAVADQHIAKLKAELGDEHGFQTHSMQRIMKLVCWFMKVSKTELHSARRPKQIVAARSMFMYLCRKYTTHSLPAIGKYCGKDHTTVINAVWRFDEIRRARRASRKQEAA